MRSFLLSAILFCAVPVFAQAPTLNVSTPPAVNQGTTFQFNCTSGCGGGTGWSVAGTDGSSNPTSGLGSITGGGLYTAPATVTVHGSAGGCQLLPPNHILNTRIDSLSVNTNNAAWLAQADANAVSFQGGLPYNIIDNSVGTQAVTITGNSGGNGNFQIVPPPNGTIQGGWYNTTGGDEHYFTVNHQTCVFAELYNPSNTGFVGDFSTSSGGATPYAGSTYTLPVVSGSGHSGSDVAGTNMMAYESHADEINYAIANSLVVGHALRLQMPNAEIKNCGTDIEGTNFLWPATNGSCSGFGLIPEGARVRLKAAISCTSWTMLCNQLKQYGAVQQDGGFQKWSIVIESDEYGAPSLGTIPTLHPTDFEFVDESGLKAAGNNSGLTTANREEVCYNGGGGTTCIDISLVGVTLGLSTRVLNFVAGTVGQQLNAYVNGTTNQSVTWSMSPSVGTLTAGGFYTPPASVASNTGEPATTTITATSAVSGAATATMVINVIQPQSGTLFLFSTNAANNGNIGFPWPTTINGATWQDMLTGWVYGALLQIGTGNAPPWPDLNTVHIYRNQTAATEDMRYDLYLPNGRYGVVAKFADTFFASCNSAHERPELQGVSLNNSLDVCASAGGEFQPYDIATNITVTTGKLSFVLRYLNGFDQGMSALQITTVGTTLTPNSSVAQGVSIQ